MKKITALFLAFVMLLSLVACAGNGDTTPDTQQPVDEIIGFEGSNTQPSADAIVSGSSELRQQLPECDEVNLDEGEWVDWNGHTALLFSSGFNTDAYEQALYDMSYHLGRSSDMEYDCGLIRDYWSDYNADPDIRIVNYFPAGTVAIIVGKPFPEDAECWELAASAEKQESELRKLLPYTNAVDMNSGEWVEQDGYGAMIFTGVEGGLYTVLGAVSDDITPIGFRQGSGYGWDDAELRDFRQSEADLDLRVGYNGDTQTLVLIVGEIPSKYTCWQLLGKTKEELGEPKFDGSVYDYMPGDAESCVRRYYADSFSTEHELAGYQACDVSLTRLEKYIAELDALGYTQTVREENGDSLYYEAQVKAYRDLDICVTAQLAWSNGKLAYAYSAPGYEIEKATLMESAANYSGSATGKDPNAPPEEGYQPLTLSEAVRVESVNGATIHYFEGSYLVQSARLYIDALTQQGYRDEQMPYVPDVKPYEIEYAHNWLYCDGMGDQSWIIVVACSRMAMVITSAQQPAYREHDLWDMVGYAMRFDVGYLETVYTEFCNEHGILGIDGESWDSNGFFANYGYDVTLSDVDWMLGELEKAGFTSFGTRTENGADIWLYCRTDHYELLDASIYARVLLKDGFGEVEFGYSARYSSENMP